MYSQVDCRTEPHASAAVQTKRHTSDASARHKPSTQGHPRLIRRHMNDRSASSSPATATSRSSNQYAITRGIVL